MQNKRTPSQKRERERYRGMLSRCYNPTNIWYKEYGGRGISVCDRWLGPEGFRNFTEDMGECPEGLSLDRIDVNGNYEPNNCRWASASIQGFNCRQHRTNTSGRTGVYWHKKDLRWYSIIIHQNVKIHLGSFRSFEDAVKAREDAEIKYFGFLKS